MLKRDIVLTDHYLHIPVRSGAQKNELQIRVDGVLVFQFAVELNDGGPYQYFFLDLGDFFGKKADILLPEPKGVTARALEGIVCGGEASEENPLYPALYREALRPQFHFSSRRGWLNDPNGLLFCDGVYHLYYQHNPLGVLHNGVNICWGHAVSEDLVHWKERSDAILPWRRDWFIASGSALLDSENAAGYGKNAIIAAFTCLGALNAEGGYYPAGGQFMAASVDGGNKFRLFSDAPAVGVENGASWRDPRIFRDGDHFVMAVYECREETDGVSFYSSKDMRDWEFTSWSRNLYECPDLFVLPVEETGEEKWVLYGADGLARIGKFEKGVFEDAGFSFPLDYGDATYAGQTWNHEPRNRRVHISWVRGMGDAAKWDEDMGYHGMPFSQCMTVPCTLTLHEDEDGFRLCRAPVEEISRLREGMPEVRSDALDGERAYVLQAGSELILELSVQSDSLRFELGRVKIIFEAKTGMLTFPGGRRRVMRGGMLTLRLLVDRTTAELFFNEELSATYATETKDMQLKLSGYGRINLQGWKLKSIW